MFFSFSRIIALTASGGQSWVATIDGIAVGTPQIGNQGKGVYITHNVFNTGLSTYTIGKLSVFRGDLQGIGGEIPLQDAGAFGYAKKDAPFSPVTVVAQESIPDKVFWAESWENGEATFGLTYQFDASTYQVSALSRTATSSVVAPTLSSDGKSMFLGGRSSTLFGWPLGNSFLMRPKWSRQIDSILSLGEFYLVTKNIK